MKQNNPPIINIVALILCIDLHTFLFILVVYITLLVLAIIVLYVHLYSGLIS